MQIIDSAVVWTASDLTAAASCEYALLRSFDVRLGRASRSGTDANPLLRQIAALGDRHEEAILAEYIRDSRVRVAELAHIDPPHSAEALTRLDRASVAAFAGPADVVYQPGFFDGEFFGYADFVVRTDAGWRVCDAKLARQARPAALLQLAAYAEQLADRGIALAPTVALLLGDGRREEFRLDDVRPVFLERRERVRTILRRHHTDTVAVVWGDDRYTACGRCDDCVEAIEATQDVLLVAGLRVDQRRMLRDAGVRTVEDLSGMPDGPPGIGRSTFERLRAQATLQLTQLTGDHDAEGTPRVVAELTDSAPDVLGSLPPPSPGDIFFDFEGDPLYNEGEPDRWGLEYLWGVLEAPREGATEGTFRPWWADDSTEERAVFIDFMTYLLRRREAFPGLHVYHYAAYEKSALLRLARRLHVYERELDDLLRLGVFVDLYATVRGAIRVSQPSYSIKGLEPLYMASRGGAKVTAGDASIVAYHEYRDFMSREESSRASRVRRSLESYNHDDCVSTMLLRNWLLDKRDEAGIEAAPLGHDRDAEAADHTEAGGEHDPAFAALMAHAGPLSRLERTQEQQAFAMLAESLGYYRRESAPYWWSHYDRLRVTVDSWTPEKDVFVVDSAEVVEDWSKATPRARLLTRSLRLAGAWGPGSSGLTTVYPVYRAPVPPGVTLPEGAVMGYRDRTSTPADVDGDSLALAEKAAATESTAETPVALVPGPGPNADVIVSAITSMSEEAVDGELPHRPDIDILTRRPPRLAAGAPLPRTGATVSDVVSALTSMTDSYVAVQGPPGTGKSWTGARVVKELVDRHHWRVGIVAQGHDVVENLLAGIVEAGLDPTLVGKGDNRSDPCWTDVPSGHRTRFLSERESTGCVLGGTAWTFCSAAVRNAGPLDLIVIDEAGQFALAPTIGVAATARRLLLLGDPQQLAQVSQGTHAEPVDASALGWLLGDHDTIPEELGYFLGQSYRMHPALCDRVSTFSYEGRLESAPSAATRRLAGVAPGLEVVTVAHEHCRTESQEEADEVLSQIQRLLGLAWRDPTEHPEARPLTERDILVVAPYNAQVTLLLRCLAAAGLPGVRVGTVDSFQGQEAPVVIVSMTASSHGDVPRGMRFLLERNRINVAISRAQWLTVLVRSTELTSFMPTSTEALLELGAFIGLQHRPRTASSST